MHSHLTLETNGQPLAHPEGLSIDLNFQNPLWNDVETYSHPFQLPCDGNREFVKIADDVNATMRLADLENATTKIIADGLPLFTGKVVTDNDVEVGPNFSFNVDSRKQSLRDQIADLKCNDIPLIDDILIGEILGDVHVTAHADVTRKMIVMVGGHGSSNPRREEVTQQGSYQAETTVNLHGLGFSYPAKCITSGPYQHAVVDKTKTYGADGNRKNAVTVNLPQIDKSYINISDEYGANSDRWGGGGAKYCNMRVCYKHRGVDSEGKTTDDVIKESASTNQGEDIWPYWVLDANRPMSGMCFYVLYFLDCLFKHLGIAWDNSELLKVEDMKRLCFTSTQCHFRTELLHGSAANPFFSESYNPPTYSADDLREGREDDEEDHYPNINGWMRSRGCGGQLNFGMHLPAPGSFGSESSQTHITVTEHFTVTANIHAMYATKENFPNESVTTLIDSLESAFGLRFLYDAETNSCRAVFLRDVFGRRLTENANIRPLLGTVLECHPVNEKISGVRVRYEAEAEPDEQRDYLRQKKRDYDTDYNYTDFRKENTVFQGVSYANIIRELISPTDEHCYVDMNTGDAFRIKVDADASTYGELRPVIFQVAHLKGIEEGDCSKEAENEDRIKDITIGFTPALLSDINYRKSRSATQPYSINALFVDADMEHEFTTQKLCSEVSTTHSGELFTNSNRLGHLSCYEILKLIESYDPTGTEYGDSPLQELDLGLTLAIMRGGGADATIQNYDEGYDGFGNSRWQMLVGTYQTDIDSMDVFGNAYDYNGTQPGDGGGEHFSLKIRAYKPFRYKIVDGVTQFSNNPAEWENDPTWLIPCVADQYADGVLTKRIRSRGLADTFLAELIHFYLHRRKLRYKMLTTVAQVADIKNHWLEWWNIDGKVGLLDTVSCNINADTGIGTVTVDMFTM